MIGVKTSIDGKDIDGTLSSDISYNSNLKAWKVLAQGSYTANVTATPESQTFSITGLPSGGIGIVYVIVVEDSPDSVYALPRSNTDALMDYPHIDAYSKDTQIDIRIYNDIAITKSIPFYYFWMEKE